MRQLGVCTPQLHAVTKDPRCLKTQYSQINKHFGGGGKVTAVQIAACRAVKSSDCGPRQTWWLKSAQPLTSVASDKWPGFSEPQFLHLKTESNNCTYFTGLLESENEVIWAKCLAWCLAPNQPEIKVSYEYTVVNSFSDSASSRCLEQIPGLGISWSSVIRALMSSYYSKSQEGQLPPPQGARGNLVFASGSFHESNTSWLHCLYSFTFSICSIKFLLAGLFPASPEVSLM